MIWHSDHPPPVRGRRRHARRDGPLSAAERFPYRPALVDAATAAASRTPSSCSAADRVAALLAERGLGPGDVLALLGAQPPARGRASPSARCAPASRSAGSAPPPPSPSWPPSSADSGVGARRHAPRRWRPAAERAGALGRRWTIGDEPAPRALHRARARRKAWAEIALLPYSSGTTGPPKGVVITHRNLSTAVRQFQAGLRLSEREHGHRGCPVRARHGLLAQPRESPLAAGATVVTMARFEPARYLELAAKHRATVLIGAPPLIAALARSRAPTSRTSS